jgi:hypothetical protein
MGRDTANQFILFAHGDDFDADGFLKATSLTFEKVWRRGEPKYPGGDVLHETSGVEKVLGDGRIIHLPEQERIACEFLKANQDSLRELACWPGAKHRILGLQRHVELSPGIGGFCMGPPSGLMAVCLDVGFRPTYYVTLDHVDRSRYPMRSPAKGDSDGGAV